MLNSKKGLTLLEIMAAALIMTFGIVPIMRFAPTILRTKATVEKMTECIFLATQKMEEVRGRALDDFDQDYNDSGTLLSGKYGYSIEDNLGADIKTISVSAWDIDRPADKYVLYTKIARR